ncbi:MAG: molybdopterin-dependent oxidoreductase, partial [Pseudobdellovibrionaceae bacterium]
MKKFWEIESISEQDVTPEFLFTNRRQIVQRGMLLGLVSMAPSFLFRNFAQAAPELKFPAKLNDNHKIPKDLELTKEELAASYNNFYEFSLDKEEVKKKVDSWKLDQKAWKVEVSGLVESKKSYSVEELCEMGGGQEERIYRFRCVEGWSMVVPWTGFQLSKLIEKLKPK